MALITEKAIVLLLVISFVQIVTLQARHTEYVFGPREHLDSGQDFRDQSSPDFELQHNNPSRNNYNPARGYLNNRHEVVQDFEEILEEDEESQLYGDEDEGLDFDYYDDDVDDEYYDELVETDDDDYYDYEVPLKRVRRRIIPIGGGALDRGRTDRNGGYGRSRSPWAEAPKNRDAVIRRSGPTGSDALFSLFPDLAPPEWKASRGIKNKKKKKSKDKATKEKDKEADSDKNKPSKNEKLEEKTQRDEPSPSDSSAHQKRKAPKKKTRISKKEKEEIAKYAESHGVETAVSHFKSRVNAPLRANAVEKFLRRYKNRMQRKANRS